MIAIDVVGLYYFFECEDVGNYIGPLFNLISPQLYGGDVCYLYEKGVKNYLIKVITELNLNYTIEQCPYESGNCCCVVATNHESYYAICGCRSNDWVVAARARCQCRSQRFDQGVVCEVGETVGCIVVAKCDDIRRGCGVSGG